jgi:molybdenum cofactor cytidylyltransferase
MPKIIPRPWVVLLAAGSSRRFGRPKLLAKIDGETLLQRAVRVALGCKASGYVVVLGANAARLEQELFGRPVRVIVNRKWRSGLASSLRAGVAALPRSARGVLILLADQVAIGPADLELLMAAWRTAPRRIVTSNSDGVRGPPAIFPRVAFPQFRALRGDEGARSLLRIARGSAIDMAMPRAAVDVDVPQDLKRASRLMKWRRG